MLTAVYVEKKNLENTGAYTSHASFSLFIL